MAQHHGLPTRLLDWTTNALVALWFVVRKPSEESEDGVVWVLASKKDDYIDDGYDNDPLSVNEIKIFQPRHLNQRIIAQSGWFTVHNYCSRLKAVAVISENHKYTKRLRRIIVKASAFRLLREELSRCGINSASLFCDLDGLTNQLEWECSPLSDEVGFEMFLSDLNKPF